MILSPASFAVKEFAPNDVIPRWWRTGRHGQRPSWISSISSSCTTVYSLTSPPLVVVANEPEASEIDP